MNYHALQEQLYSLLTEEEKKEGCFYVKIDPLSLTKVYIGEDDIEYIFIKSSYRNYIIGFKRDKYGICLILDEEGQKKWDDKVKDIERFYGI